MDTNQIVKKGNKIFKWQILILVLMLLYPLTLGLVLLLPSESARWLSLILIIVLSGIFMLVATIAEIILCIKGLSIHKKLKSLGLKNKKLLVSSWIILILSSLLFLNVVVSKVTGKSIFPADNSGTVPTESISNMSIDDFKIMCSEKGGRFNLNENQVTLDNGAALGSCTVQGQDANSSKIYWLNQK